MKKEKLANVLQNIHFKKFGGPGSGRYPAGSGGDDTDVVSDISTNSKLSTADKEVLVSNINDVKSIIESNTSDEKMLDDAQEKINDAQMVIYNNKELDSEEKNKLNSKLNKLKSKVNNLYED